MRAYNARRSNKGLSNGMRNMKSNVYHFMRAIRGAKASLCSDHDFGSKVDIYFIDDQFWAGDYGHLGWIDFRENQIHNKFDDVKVFQVNSQTLHELANRTDLSIFWWINHDEPGYDGVNENYSKIDSVFIHRNKSDIIWSEHYNRYFIKMSNGQLFDMTNRYWFTKSDSKVLNEYLEKGYKYYDPQSFFEDVYA